ncbi:polyprenyl synthetase family protein [Flavivirga eckloniae]|uniref:Geranyl transferase n=1 Tax=Flavivirga eckloniae TaxID=1803846 RepID=A0A2K9PVX7_9FLAO|nr:polyprenyl synthetase family protein [Flavivirga eckloniae]AUP81235.1 geranyl transferase [Flavivirga eckloniae]
MEKLKAALERTKSKIDTTFKNIKFSDNNILESTNEAMYYMLNLGDGGKRIRPAIVLTIAEGFNGNQDQALEFAKAVEFIHTYTLIIDDIQDDDDIRRNAPTCHIKYDVNTAILAASRLFEEGLYPFHKYCENIELFRKLNNQLHKGQCADLNAESWEEDMLLLQHLQFIHSGKTSALIQMAILGGCISSKLSEQQTSKLLEYGYYLGLAFQAKDDILSKTETAQALGKSAGKQADKNKLTYPSLFGSVENAQIEADKLSEKAMSCLDKFEKENVAVLLELAKFTVQRKR